ncbi:hypothetical protein RHMOL_Rhmol04G0136800 [Rhododendron molle]|uniref:Uncharacterized protein n=1 Tax=Rhododendron molle TaxID=49168 RepID=A0ACC0P166_RHOML|nr:hypothetical protein RHMOL_Rhmol04G0136800 [Rhododendron molle]
MFHGLQIKRPINLEVMHSLNTRVMKGRGKDLMKGEESESGRNLVGILMTDQGIVIIGARKRATRCNHDGVKVLGLIHGDFSLTPIFHIPTCT